MIFEEMITLSFCANGRTMKIMPNIINSNKPVLSLLGKRIRDNCLGDDDVEKLLMSSFIDL